MNLFESMNKGFEKKYLANKKSLNEAFRPALDEVLDILDIAGYDIDRDDVKAYAEAAAEYIEMAREEGNHYSAAQWYKDTKANYPEDLEMLKAEVVEESIEKPLDEESNMEKLQKKFPELMEEEMNPDEGKEEVEEKIEENLGDDIADYQRWVDYDMKRYGKISDITNDHIEKAGLTVTKNDHGDYEVIAKEE
nr:MAG TPA: hypothetical protein [Caudoviricetes sp.]